MTQRGSCRLNCYVRYGLDVLDWLRKVCPGRRQLEPPTMYDVTQLFSDMQVFLQLRTRNTCTAALIYLVKVFKVRRSYSEDELFSHCTFDLFIHNCTILIVSVTS